MPKRLLTYIKTPHLLFPLVLMGCVTLTLFWELSRFHSLNNWVNHTDQVIANVNILEKEIIDLETGVLSFVITGDPDFLEPYDKATTDLPSTIHRLRSLTRDNPPQGNRLNQIEATEAEWKIFGEAEIHLVKIGADAPSQVKSGRGKHLIDSIRTMIEEMRSEEEQLKVKRVARVQQDSIRLLSMLSILTVLLFIWIFRNLRLRVRAEDQHRKSEEKFRLILDQASDGIFEANLQRHYTDVNHAGLELLGYSRDEMLKLKIDDLLPAEELPRALQNVEDYQKFGATKVAEWHLKKKDGSYLPVELSGKLYPDQMLRGFVRDITVRKKDKEMLEASERKFHTLAEAMPQIVWACNSEGMNTYFNQQWVDYTGMTLEESYCHGWNKPFHPDDQQRSWDAWQKAVKTDGVYSLECRLRRFDGVYKWWLIRGSSLHDENGKVIEWFGTCTDIEEMKRAEEALATSEEKYRVLFEGAYDAILVTDLNGKMVSINPQLEKKFGYTKNELVGQPIEILIPERFRRSHVEHRNTYSKNPHARAMGTGLDLYGRKKDGSEFPIDINLSPVMTRDGKQINAIIRDMTARKTFENQVTFLSHLSKTLSETMNYQERLQLAADTVASKIADLCVVAILEENQLKFKAIGTQHRSSRELLQTFASHIVSAKDGRYTADYALKTGEPLLVEDVKSDLLNQLDVDEDQKKRVELIGITSFVTLPLKGRDSILGTVTFSMTDSGRKLSRDDIPFLELIANRCALGAENAKLYLEAQEAIQTREDVMAIISHDLRNPLSAIALNAQMLLLIKTTDPLVSERLKQSSDSIAHSAKVMERLIANILDLTKIKAGSFANNPSAQDGAGIIRTLIESMNPIARARSIHLVEDLEPNLPKVLCDHDRVMQVLSNLVGNSLKFTPEGGIITIGAQKKGQEVCFSVADTGKGISPEELPHVFERYWQAKEAVQKGTGLGLSIAKSIVAVHKGKIWVESKVGEGSCFYFTLPIYETPLGPTQDNHQGVLVLSPSHLSAMKQSKLKAK